jgi:hypothetical protein
MIAMDFEELVRVWRDTATGDVRRTRIESLEDLRRRTTRSERNARKRVRRATIIWLVLVPWFGFWAIAGVVRGNAVFAVGCLIAVIGCTAPAFYLRRISNSTGDPTLPLGTAVAREVERMRSLQTLIRRMIDWVVGSLVVGGPLIVAGSSSSPARTALFGALCVVVGLVSRRGWRRIADRMGANSMELESWLTDLQRV